MLPSTQHADTISLNWFKIICYLNNLLQQCFWYKNALGATASPWLLHYNELTPHAYSKSKALLSFLSQHCPPFRSCKLPSVPPLLTVSQTGHRTSSGSGSAQSSAAQLAADAHLFAAENELSVVWTSPYLSSSDVADRQNTAISESEEESTKLETEEAKISNENVEKNQNSDDIIVGYFALNQRTVRSSVPSNLASFGFECFVVKMSSERLATLHQTWAELASASKAVLMGSRSSSRPLSRSPSKQKKLEKPLQIPEELAERLELAVISLAEALGYELTREQIPKLELQSVSPVAEVLKPFSQTTVKGEACCFYKSLFNLSQ